MAAETIASIRNLRIVDAHLATAGQPSEGQLQAIAADHYEVVINLALHDDPRYSLKDEAATVGALGMQYIHIPVQFSAPALTQLHEFCAAMAASAGRKVFVHCAANYRVTAFVGLDRVLRQQWDEERAFALMREIWQPDETWQRFIADALAGET